MGCRGGFAVLLLAVQVISLPVTNPVDKGDAKVMKCIVEVISDTLSKPSPLPISQECLETLRGDERIISILRHQNLLKELQELAVKGANERTWQQKKNGGFEDELSEVLESQNDKNMQRDKSREIAAEEPTASFAELAAERSQQNSEREESKEDEKNSLEERELRLHEAGPEDKENAEESDSNEVSEAEESPREDVLDNHINDDLREDELAEHKLQEAEEEQPEETDRSRELQGEKKQIPKKDLEESQEAEEETLQEHTEEEDTGRSTLEDEQPTEADRLLGSAEDETEETPREGDNKDALGFGQGLKSSEEEEKSHGLKGGRHRSEDEAIQAEDTFHPRDVKSEEVEEEPSREWEESKRWNKMDELAKQLTSKKRMEENDSSEDPDRSMKMSFRPHKYDFHNPEEDMRRSWKHHAKEDSSEAGFPLAAMPEEKKDEEGSANRRTEDQELESLAAIEAELEKVAHKLHELRRG
ncbi:6.8 kDa mitochondrial proteolipid [Platysternon megacephalum]|uniref:Chromogranin-A n=1 Tax=Platysternon megacephalum TaxID=55544 RepID=A0A4D9EX11_9SAUR|nr:6.8 kDa mitochondrial proteolipid [Platysternon megacephalum]